MSTSAVFLTPAPRTDPQETIRSIAEQSQKIADAWAKEPPRLDNLLPLDNELSNMRFQLAHRRETVRRVTDSVRELRRKLKELTKTRDSLIARNHPQLRYEIAAINRDIDGLVGTSTDVMGRKTGTLSQEEQRLTQNEGLVVHWERMIESFYAEHPGFAQMRETQALIDGLPGKVVKGSFDHVER